MTTNDAAERLRARMIGSGADPGEVEMLDQALAVAKSRGWELGVAHERERILAAALEDHAQGRIGQLTLAWIERRLDAEAER
jgi:hypothetical protein